MDGLVDVCDTGKTIANPYDSGGHKRRKFSLAAERVRQGTSQRKVQGKLEQRGTK